MHSTELSTNSGRILLRFYMIDDEFKRAWIKSYKKVRKYLRNDIKACGGSESLFMSNLSRKSEAITETLKELATTRKNDGNLVPLIMARMMSGNIAMECISLFTHIFMLNQRPSCAAEELERIVYEELAVPFCITLWESVQKDLIVAELNEEPASE